MNFNALVLIVALALPDSVCVTENGMRYHKVNVAHCAGEVVLRVDAETAGFVACKTCFAPKKTTKKSRPYDRLRKPS